MKIYVIYMFLCLTISQGHNKSNILEHIRFIPHIPANFLIGTFTSSKWYFNVSSNTCELKEKAKKYFLFF